MSTSDSTIRPDGFLASLSRTERDALEQIGIRRTFPSGSVLMFESEPGERVMILVRGRVKVSRSAADGRELLLGICDPGDLLGEVGVIDQALRTATVTALDPVEAIVISARAFDSHLARTPRVAGVVLSTIAHRLRVLVSHHAQVATADTLGRVAARIVELADRYGEPCPEGVVIPMPISQDELASWAGACRAGTAQALKTMRGLHWIVTERRRLIIRDLDALRARAA